MVRFGERGVKKGDLPVANWRTDLNEMMVRDAWVVSCVVEWCGGSEPWEASLVCLLSISY